MPQQGEGNINQPTGQGDGRRMRTTRQRNVSDLRIARQWPHPTSDGDDRGRCTTGCHRVEVFPAVDVDQRRAYPRSRSSGSYSAIWVNACHTICRSHWVSCSRVGWGRLAGSGNGHSSRGGHIQSAIAVADYRALSAAVATARTWQPVHGRRARGAASRHRDRHDLHVLIVRQCDALDVKARRNREGKRITVDVERTFVVLRPLWVLR